MNFELITLFRELEKNRGGESPRCRRCVRGCADLWPWPYITLVFLADGRQRLLVERLHYFPHFGAAFAQSSHLAISPLLSQPRCLKKKPCVLFTANTRDVNVAVAYKSMCVMALVKDTSRKSITSHECFEELFTWQTLEEDEKRNPECSLNYLFRSICHQSKTVKK